MSITGSTPYPGYLYIVFGVIKQSLHRYFIILSCFIDQNIQNHVKIDYDDQNQNITFMIKIWILCVHHGFNIVPRMFIYRIWGNWISLHRYFIILSCFIDKKNIQNYINDNQNQNITFMIHVSITGAISSPDADKSHSRWLTMTDLKFF